MTQPLNFTPKAMDHLRNGIDRHFEPRDAEAARFILAKLDAAQVFVLPENGHILDRTKEMPTIGGARLRPPFPVIALEYTATSEAVVTKDRMRSSRRIALAWEWADDLPPSLGRFGPTITGDGVALMSVAYMDEFASWSSPAVAFFIPYDQVIEPAGRDIRISVESFGIMPSRLEQIAARGEAAHGIMKDLQSDLVEECRAYLDLCCALACRNVGTCEVPPPGVLNKRRAKAGKLPLKGFHVLEMRGGGGMPGAGGYVGDRSGPRSHLRRGHIRRLGADRVTWVNSSIVRGRGFVDKVYAI